MMAMVALECGDDRAKGGVMSRLAESSRSRGHVAGRPVRRHLGARLSALPPLAAAASTATLGFEGGALQQGRRHCATMVMMALVPGGQEGREETSLRDPDAAAAAAGSCTIVGSRQCRPLTSSVPRHPSPFTTVTLFPYLCPRFIWVLVREFLLIRVHISVLQFCSGKAISNFR
ncbi:uncharacterized protein [Oryza sativa Japonica Group]|uniref:Os02g0453100 protein n=2 Tax=Oryza sativa subsp. japonica TaxID=39947 RepID=A0A0P0VIK1_ORYSJ|nr:hypothetical protein EE612_011098 [Oryza sativa]BAD19499.1 unknown protein [Oryza sativa Japonica Group]BAF08680.1 Os02g0453100 [Oryza sativa Japonica Group]BAG99822.1 unnamed protein product [Oryza sativa Japonica Group]BAS78509.1 Os02g0453100 [Oryza sativa Japonica Group]|eukprot:NP_001046766.1 Os02g0453100 [Oryza sativa Japonica Group]